MPGGLFFVFLHFYWFEVLGFEDLTAVQTFDVIHAVSPGDYLCTGMVASGLHNNASLRFILTGLDWLSSPPLRVPYRRDPQATPTGPWTSVHGGALQSW